MNVSLAAKTTALQSLINAALSNPGELTRHLEALVGLQLLSEGSDETDNKKGAAYVQAVESVFSTAFRIADRPQAADRAAGIALLEVAGQHCSTRAFLKVFPAWSTQLLALAKKHHEDGQPWGALRAILVRAAGLVSVQGIRQETASLATRVAGAITPLLRQPSGDGETGEGVGPAVECLIAAVAAAPAAFRSHLKPLEQYAASALVARSSSIPTRKNASNLLSLLPSITGKVEQWSSLFHALLATAHHELDALYSGLQDSQEALAYRAGLMPGAKPLQSTGHANGLVLNDGTARTSLQSLAAALDCAERLMSQSAAQPVPVPDAQLIMLCSRILSVDDSLTSTGRTPSSASAYQVLLAALPKMHASAFRLLRLLASVCKGALTPLHGALVAIASLSLQRIASDDCGSLASGSPCSIRSEVYEYTAHLLQHAGWGAVRDLTAQVLQCALLELYSGAPGDSSAAQQPSEGSGKKRKRQRAQQQQQAAAQQADLAALAKGVPTPGSSQDYHAPSGVEALHQAASQIAALRMVQTLHEVGGAVMSLETRAQLDAVVAHQASTAATAMQQQSWSGAAAAPVPGALHLAALQALLASMLAPCRHAPPFLPRALVLFSQARNSSIPEVHAFSAQALAACEALIHPRCPPPWPSHAASERLGESRKAQNTPEYLGIPRMWSPTAVVPPAHHEPVLSSQSPHEHRMAAEQQVGAAALPSSSTPASQPGAHSMQPPHVQALTDIGTGAASHGASFAGVPSASKQKQHGAAGAAASVRVDGQAGPARQQTSAPVQANVGEQALVQPEKQAELLKLAPKTFIEKVPRRGVTDRRTLQAESPHEGKAPAAGRMLPKPAESDSEGSMPPIDSGNESDMEDESSGDESTEVI